jgi:hypothetical protein
MSLGEFTKVRPVYKGLTFVKIIASWTRVYFDNVYMEGIMIEVYY